MANLIIILIGILIILLILVVRLAVKNAAISRENNELIHENQVQINEAKRLLGR